MSKRIPLFLGLMAAAALALGAVACSDDDESDADQVGGAESEFCSDLAALDTSLAQLRSLSASSTVDDAEEARENVQQAMEDVRSSAKKLAEAKADQLEDAYNDFDNAVEDLPSDEQIGQALTSLQSEAAGVVTAEAQLRQQANCP